MKIIGLTGGIASGKSLLAKWFREAGIELLDADAIYKSLLKTNKILYNKIVAYFGKRYATETGELNTALLGKYVFENKEELLKLNAITHPFVLTEMQSQIEAQRKAGCPLLILDIPLLYEAKLEYLCDRILLVYVDKETQIERLMRRDQISREMAIHKIDSQMDMAKKAGLSDYVVDNSETPEQTKIQFERILNKLRSEEDVN